MSLKDKSGYFLSLSYNRTVLAIGAYYNDGAGQDAGHVRVYEWNGSDWNQRGGDVDGEHALDGSGRSVSLSGDGNVAVPWKDALTNRLGGLAVLPLK